MLNNFLYFCRLEKPKNKILSNMANVNVKEKDAARKEAIQETVSRTDEFFKNNKKTLWGVLIAVVVVAAAILGYYKFIYTPKVEEALEQTFPAENLFAAGEYEVALNGDGNVLGFAGIIDEYGKKAGEAVYFHAGVCAYKLGNYEEAINYLKKYAGKEPILMARAKSTMGDAYVGLENYDAALGCFKDAAAVSDNLFAATYYVKAGEVYEALGNKEEAAKCYETVKDQYPNSMEAADIDKYISRVK